MTQLAVNRLDWNKREHGRERAVESKWGLVV
jgi:hypothetical protein